MARIADDEIERLKKEISVQRLAEARGIKLTRHGADLLGKCPFHDDKTPSLVITPKKNLWHCLGACNMGGTAIDWVMKTEGISFRHAVELLRKDHLPSATSPIQPVKKSTVPKLPAPLTAQVEDRALLLEVVDYYGKTLKQSPEAMKYLEGRGLMSSEIIDRFKLGFANRTLGYGLEAKNRAGGAAVRGRLQRLGVLRDSGHEHFNGSLVIPVLTLAGDVAEMYGRKITRMTALRDGTAAHLYLPGEHRGVWNEESLIASKEIILCEALIDALTFWWRSPSAPCNRSTRPRTRQKRPSSRPQRRDPQPSGRACWLRWKRRSRTTKRPAAKKNTAMRCTVAAVIAAEKMLSKPLDSFQSRRNQSLMFFS